MTLEEISDGSYFVKDRNPKIVYRKIGSRSPIPGEIYGVAVQELHVGLNNVGFARSLMESSINMTLISEEDAYDKYTEKAKDAIKKYEKNLEVLRELLTFLNK